MDELLAEWDQEKNAQEGVAPDSISYGSTRKVWWKCKRGHGWQASPNNRSRGQGCPVCAGRKVLAGENDLRTRFPAIAAEWSVRNQGIRPEEVTSGSNKRVWWRCHVCEHEWQTAVANRTAGKGCPVCARKSQGERRVAGIVQARGSFGEMHPELLEEWDNERNNVSPFAITPDSTARVWWRCKYCGYEWETRVASRTLRKTGCPACKNKVATIQNCLQTKRPDLLTLWDYSKNSDITTLDVTPGSSKKVWWKCQLGHSWQATVTAVANGVRCPICAGQKVLAGFNDLATVNPELAGEWNIEKNGALTPQQIMQGSSREKVWWLCPWGHEYQATVANRSRGSGCPICGKERKTSFPEQAIWYYLKKNTTALNRYLLNGETEIDVYLPELKIGIEYDGSYFHESESAKKREARKNDVVEKAGVRLLRVKEFTGTHEMLSSEDVICCRHTANYDYLADVIKQLTDRIYEISGVQIPADVDIQRDGSAIYAQYIEGRKESSLAARNPALAAEWHPEKNGTVRPEMVSHSSTKAVWWLGRCGHEWRSSVDNRKHGNGCPICAGFQVLVGFNDLATTHPELCKEWVSVKNGELTPEQVTRGSRKKVWWMCPKGHEYEATVANRVSGRGCPVCALDKRTLIRKINRIAKDGSLAQTHPALAAEWATAWNELRPEDVTKGSDRKVWWICGNGHTYEATVANRVHGRGCPICRTRKKLHAARNENSGPDGCQGRCFSGNQAKRFWNSVTISSALSITTSITLLPTDTTRELFCHCSMVSGYQAPPGEVPSPTW